MKLAQVIARLEKDHDKVGLVPPAEVKTEECLEIDVHDLTHDTRKIAGQSLFACVPGTRFDGHDFAGEAIKNGAVALLCERKLPDMGVPQILVQNVRLVLGRLSAAIHKDPSDSMMMVAVTGTNGKTTTAHMIHGILEKGGYKTGMIGTIVYDEGDGPREADRTTPEATDIQRMLSAMLRNNCRACVMEASSHGLALGRLSGCRFDAAIFTNLTEEHLDFHGNMDRYLSAKSLLFSHHAKGAGTFAVINADDSYGKRIAQTATGKKVFYGLKRSRPENGMYVKGSVASMDLSGSSMSVSFCESEKKTKETAFNLTIPLIGRYNLYNALASTAFALASGITPETVNKGLSSLKTVPGRLERWKFVGGPSAIVDYAHTPDALLNALNAVREICRGRVWLVFGLGGERYQANRPVMGEIAAQGADELIITMDNPRSEDPLEIAEAIKSGAIRGGCSSPRIVIDRKEAVFYALDRADTDDVVVVTGKGPEQYIIIDERRIPYNDAEAIKEWARVRGRHQC
ncbi:MAG: UDP-N-acetylmuramoyl-L-alanyl-D-glutamate--2,6-diaminopimelate ligase [Thermovirgaceae bacterium]